jgi:hypothetical protein
VPWTSAERALEQTLRRVDAAIRPPAAGTELVPLARGLVRHGMRALRDAGGREAALAGPPDPRVRALCGQITALARRLAAGDAPRRAGQARVRRPAQRVAQGWLSRNAARIRGLFDELTAPHDIETLTECLAMLQAAGERVRPRRPVQQAGVLRGYGVRRRAQLP